MLENKFALVVDIVGIAVVGSIVVVVGNHYWNMMMDVLIRSDFVLDMEVVILVEDIEVLE